MHSVATDCELGIAETVLIDMILFCTKAETIIIIFFFYFITIITSMRSKGVNKCV